MVWRCSLHAAGNHPCTPLSLEVTVIFAEFLWENALEMDARYSAYAASTSEAFFAEKVRLPPGVQRLLARTLQRDATARSSAADILADPWLAEDDAEAAVSGSASSGDVTM